MSVTIWDSVAAYTFQVAISVYGFHPSLVPEPRGKTCFRLPDEMLIGDVLDATLDNPVKLSGERVCHAFRTKSTYLQDADHRVGRTCHFDDMSN